MAIYRFRVSFEDYDDVTREIDVLPKHTFLDFHNAIHAATGYNPELPSSFYVSNDRWKKGKEIAYLPSDAKSGQGVELMETSKLNRFVNDPHQKFYYIYNFDRPVDFHVQLVKILKEEDGKTYPALFKSTGQVPKLPGAKVVADETAAKKEDDEYDFLGETEYGINEEEDLDMLDEEEQEDNKEEGNDGFGDDY